MGLDDRLWYLLLGMAIGFVLGRITRLDRNVREIKEELDEVDEIVKEKLDPDHRHSEEGFIKTSGWSGVVLFIVLIVTVGAAFLSQKASNDSHNVDKRLAAVSACNATYLTKTITTLNQRTSYSGEQAHANVNLQKDQATFFNLLLHRPPFSEHKRFSAAQDSQKSLQTFLAIVGKVQDKAELYPFPTSQELRDCITRAVK